MLDDSDRSIFNPSELSGTSGLASRGDEGLVEGGTSCGDGLERGDEDSSILKPFEVLSPLSSVCVGVGVSVEEDGGGGDSPFFRIV